MARRRPQFTPRAPFLLALLVLLVLLLVVHAFIIPTPPSLSPPPSRQPAPPPPRARSRHRPLLPPARAAAAADSSDEDEGAAGARQQDGGFGLTWYAADRYRQQPDFPVLFLATRNESYAREVERHFSEQGYLVRSTRTVTRLAKMIRSTRPEGILLSDHLSAPHLLSFLESLRDLPDLWLVPVLLVHDSLVAPAANDNDNSGSSNSKRRQRRSSSSPSSMAAEQQQQQQLHHEALRLGARCVVTPAVKGEAVQAMVEGSRRTRRDVEGIVHNLQGAVLHWAQHRRRLLPSTVILEEPPPPLSSTEQEVLNLLCRGMTDAQIGHSLGLTSAAVGHAARAVMEKLGCDLRGELIRVALDNDLVTE